MNPQQADTLQQALSLPVEQRLQLIEKLLESLNLPLASDIEAAWAEVAEARREAIISGKAKTLDGEAVVNELREKYGE